MGLAADRRDATGTQVDKASRPTAPLALWALTTTLEYSYGSRIVVPGAGFLLNNEMGDFNAEPGRTTTGGLIGTTPNLAAPGKRMISSMTPTLILRDDRILAALGSPGGRTIINTVLCVTVRLLDHEFGLQSAKVAQSSGVPKQTVPRPAGLRVGIVHGRSSGTRLQFPSGRAFAR